MYSERADSPNSDDIIKMYEIFTLINNDIRHVIVLLAQNEYNSFTSVHRRAMRKCKNFLILSLNVFFKVGTLYTVRINYSASS